jgi:hypothetical protein
MTGRPPKRYKTLYFNDIFFAIRRAIRENGDDILIVNGTMIRRTQCHGGETMPVRHRDSRQPAPHADSRHCG